MKTHHGHVVDESNSGFISSDVGEFLQRRELDARRATRVPTRVQEVARDQRQVQNLLKKNALNTSTS